MDGIMSLQPDDNNNNNNGNDETCDTLVCWPFRRRRRGGRNNNRLHRNHHLVVTTNAASSSAHSRRPPRLVNIRREASPLLTACWQQDWTTVLRYLETDQIYHRSHNSGRLALHLSAMPGSSCPTEVLLAVLRADPYAVVTADYHQYGGTPLHFCCGSKVRERPRVIKEMVDTALRVQASCSPQHNIHIRLSYWSPLYQAAKWAAPPATLLVLVRASHVQIWIAPWTGAESWRRQDQIRQASLTPARDSPLKALWCRNTPKRLLSIHGLPIERMRQLTLDYYAATDPWEFWWSRHAESVAGEEQQQAADVVHYAKVLVLLKDQTNSVDELLHTAASLHASIPPLVRLLAVLWPEQLLTPNTRDGGRLPLHAAAERYVASNGIRHQTQAAAQVLEILAVAQPQALAVPDPDTGLPPACRVAPYASSSVDVIYTLLRPVPTLVPMMGYVPTEGSG